jgi:hypothetical protein
MNGTGTSHAHSASLTVPFKRLIHSDIEHRVIVDGDGDSLCEWKLDGWNLDIVNVEPGFCSFHPKPCEDKPWMTSLPLAWNSLGWTPDLRLITGNGTDKSPMDNYVHSTLTLGGARDANCVIPRNHWGRELVFTAGVTPRKQAFSDRVRLKVRSTTSPMKIKFTKRTGSQTGFVTLTDGAEAYFFATPMPRASGAEPPCDKGKVRLNHFLAFYAALGISVPNPPDPLVPIADCPEDVERNLSRSAERALTYDDPIRKRSIEPVYCPPAMF